MNIPQLTGLEALLQQQSQQGSTQRENADGRTSQTRQKSDMSWLFEESMDD